LNQTGTGFEGGSSIIIGNSSSGISTPHNRIGGTTAAARNVIAGSIEVNITTDDQTVQGNYIGTDVNGTAYLGGGVSLSNGSTVKGNVVAGQVSVRAASL